MSDRNQVFQMEAPMSRANQWYSESCDCSDRRQMTEEQEMMADQEMIDRAIVLRVDRGETNHLDALYLAGRLNVKNWSR